MNVCVVTLSLLCACECAESVVCLDVSSLAGNCTSEELYTILKAMGVMRFSYSRYGVCKLLPPHS